LLKQGAPSKNLAGRPTYAKASEGRPSELLGRSRTPDAFLKLGRIGRQRQHLEDAAPLAGFVVGYSYLEQLMATRSATLEYLTTTKIGEKGQLTVPKQFREALGLGTGAPFAVLRLGDGLVLLPEQQRFENLCAKVGDALTRAGVTPEAILATLPEARERVFARRYKSSPSSGKGPQRRRRVQRKK